MNDTKGRKMQKASLHNAMIVVRYTQEVREQVVGLQAWFGIVGSFKWGFEVDDTALQTEY